MDTLRSPAAAAVTIAAIVFLYVPLGVVRWLPDQNPNQPSYFVPRIPADLTDTRHRRHYAGLVAESPQLLIQLPGADPSAALPAPQAAALLGDFLSAAQEVETVVRAAREVEPGRGYVELQRRYRVTGTQEVRIQSLLLGYRLSRTGWSLVELRVVG